MKVVNYSGGENIKFKLEKCPLCGKEHEYEFSISETVILYSARQEAYRPRDRQLVLTCPKSGNYYKVVSESTTHSTILALRVSAWMENR